MLIDDILSYIEKVEKDNYLYHILDLYDKNKINTECLSFIDSITNKLKQNINSYQQEEKDILYNLLDNDFVTLKDLYQEAKDTYNSLFSLNNLIFLKNLYLPELKLYYSELLKLKDLEPVNLLKEELSKYLSKDIKVEDFNEQIHYLREKISLDEYHNLLIKKLHYDLIKGYNSCGRP